MNFSKLDFSTKNMLVNFLPVDCMAKASSNTPASTVIAYGPNNTIAWQVVQDLNATSKLLIYLSYRLDVNLHI
jgi:hypothetical protein